MYDDSENPIFKGIFNGLLHYMIGTVREETRCFAPDCNIRTFLKGIAASDSLAEFRNYVFKFKILGLAFSDTRNDLPGAIYSFISSPTI
jgi:hypothetical protein